MTNNNTTPTGKLNFAEWLEKEYGDRLSFLLESSAKQILERPFHEGDCTKEPFACWLCALESTLQEYREYVFGEDEQPVVPLAEVTDLLNLKNEYIKLLGQEIDDLIGLASIHGWKSELVEKGIVLREKIATAENNFNQYLNTNDKEATGSDI